MYTKIVEVESANKDVVGYFMVGMHDWEWTRKSEIMGGTVSLLRHKGWSRDHFWLFDLATGQGAIFADHGHVLEDLKEADIQVTPMFSSYLAYLRSVGPFPVQALPDHIVLPEYEKVVLAAGEHFEEIPHTHHSPAV